MSILQLHRSTAAPSENLPAIMAVPGDCRLWGTSGWAAEGDILPYLSHQVGWRLREQRVLCERKRRSYFVYNLKVVSALKCRLTSNLQTNRTSRGPSRAAGHTGVLTSIDLLHPSNVKGPVVNILLSKQCGPHLKLPWKHTQTVLICFSSVGNIVYIMYYVDLDLPLNQCTWGGGAPEAWHSSTASAPTDTWISCWVTFILGASGWRI